MKIFNHAYLLSSSLSLSLISAQSAAMANMTVTNITVLALNLNSIFDVIVYLFRWPVGKQYSNEFHSLPKTLRDSKIKQKESRHTINWSTHRFIWYCLHAKYQIYKIDINRKSFVTLAHTQAQRRTTHTV